MRSPRRLWQVTLPLLTGESITAAFWDKKVEIDATEDSGYELA